jgi:mycothiol maleylpyruvate isomerase-like protein
MLAASLVGAPSVSGKAGLHPILQGQEATLRTPTERIDGIKADQQFWRDLAAEVGPDRYAEPGAMGEWTFGDLAGHLLGWRNRTIARLEAAARGEPDPIPDEPEGDDEVDAANVRIRENDAGRSPAELVDAYTASYDRLIRALEALPESKLADPEAFPWVGGPLIDIPFTGHLHEEHVPSVRAWLDGR